MPISLSPIKIVQKEVADELDEQIFLPDQFIDLLKIEKNQDLRICIGNKYKMVKVRSTDTLIDEAQFPDHIILDFLLPLTSYKFQINIAHDQQTLYLGPIVALLTDFLPYEKDEPNFRSIHAFCEELHQSIAEVGGFFYVFTFHDFSDDEVSGYYFENGSWHYTKLPIPDVIYNRIHSRRMEQHKSFQIFRDKIEQLSIPFFNDRFLSKWEVYQHFMLVNTIQPYIPETMIFSKENLMYLLERYQIVFIKPVHGSQGRNIIKLIRNDEQVSFHTSQNPISDNMISNYLIEEIYDQLKPLLLNRNYIIQQGIFFAEYQSRAMDFRVLVHNTNLKVWDITSIVARISAEQQFVSNIAKGGQIMKPLIALYSCFNKKLALEIMAAIKELSIEAAAIISSKSQGITGELGIDIGVDHNGKPWIIEINSKPSKNNDNHTDKIRPSAKAIIQFCSKLAFNSIHKKEE